MKTYTVEKGDQKQIIGKKKSKIERRAKKKCRGERV